MIADGGEFYGRRWPPGYEPMRANERRGWTSTASLRASRGESECGLFEHLSGPQDEVQELAERVTKRLYGTKLPHYQKMIAQIIASELRAGRWKPGF